MIQHNPKPEPPKKKDEYLLLHPPPLKESPSFDRRMGTAKKDGAPSLRHLRCSVTGLLGTVLLRCSLWVVGSHTHGDVWIVHRICMLADAGTLSLALPLAMIGLEKITVRSGMMGIFMCWVTSMLVVDFTGLAINISFRAPLLCLQVGVPGRFWQVVREMVDSWVLALLTSFFLQAVIAVSAWRIYREMRVQRLYPANSVQRIARDEVHQLEVCCEPEDVAQCRADCINVDPTRCEPVVDLLAESADSNAIVRLPTGSVDTDLLGLPGYDFAVMEDSHVEKSLLCNEGCREKDDMEPESCKGRVGFKI